MSKRGQKMSPQPFLSKKMSKSCYNPLCDRTISALRRSGYCDVCYESFRLGYHNGYNTCVKKLKESGFDNV